MKIDNKFFKTPNDIYDYNLNGFEILVYTYLCRCSNNKEFAFPSYSTIAEKCGIGRNTAISVVKSLVEIGLIVKDGRNKENKKLSNIYIIKTPKEIELNKLKKRSKKQRGGRQKEEDSNEVSSLPHKLMQFVPQTTESLPHKLGGSLPDKHKEELSIYKELNEKENAAAAEEEQILAVKNKKIESLNSITDLVNIQHQKELEELKNTPTDLEFSNSYDRLLKLNAFKSYKEKIKPSDKEISEMTELLNKHGEGKLSVALGEALMAFNNKSTEDYFGVVRNRLISFGG